MVDLLFAITVGVLFSVGVFQMLRRDLIKAAMGFSILFTAINLYIIAVGAFDGNVPAYANQPEDSQSSDPLVQALILTAIVVSFGSYALLLSFVTTIARRFETLDSDEVNELVG
ncbi:MAG: cation:proton antiporter [Anaerolineae bacterium]|nr:cation:proton antiporter [Anaerolineae bacterium]